MRSWFAKPAWMALVTLVLAGCGPGTISGGGSDDSVDPTLDTDGDGLPDVWEQAYGDSGRLDWRKADSDGNGINDGDEDYDGDGLTNLEEFAASRLTGDDPGQRPNPFRRDLLVELDAMQGRLPPASTLDGVAEAFAALPLQNADGSEGVFVHFIQDETDIPAVDFSGSIGEQNAFFKAHGPHLDDGHTPPLPLGKMIHVVAATRRTDLSDRGGDTVPDQSGGIEGAGVFLYRDVINQLFPACARTVAPVLPAITPEEMISATLIHELGHTLQLGHDTDAGGGINNFNIMSEPTNCGEAQMRERGDGNSDPSLGATDAVGKPRFSAAAAALMDFLHKLSVDTGAIENGTGREM